MVIILFECEYNMKNIKRTESALFWWSLPFTNLRTSFFWCQLALNSEIKPFKKGTYLQLMYHFCESSSLVSYVCVLFCYHDFYSYPPRFLFILCAVHVWGFESVVVMMLCGDKRQYILSNVNFNSFFCVAYVEISDSLCLIPAVHMFILFHFGFFFILIGHYFVAACLEQSTHTSVYFLPHMTSSMPRLPVLATNVNNKQRTPIVSTTNTVNYWCKYKLFGRRADFLFNIPSHTLSLPLAINIGSSVESVHRCLLLGIFPVAIHCLFFLNNCNSHICRAMKD